MLINLSNHPQLKWDKKQLSTAIKQYGSVLDMSFPNINPQISAKEVGNIVLEFYTRITNIFDECANTPFENAVHIQGEFTFVFQLVTLLKKSNIPCVASTSNRNVVNDGDKKIIEFNFVQFREY